jgi:hypothetical protein
VLNFRVLVSGFRFLALSKLEKSIDWQTMLGVDVAWIVCRLAVLRTWKTPRFV